MIVKIDTQGNLQFIWNDKLRPLFDAGAGVIRRASNVEPTEDGRWQADLAPVGGPKLEPTLDRADALSSEVAWLEENLLGAK